MTTSSDLTFSHARGGESAPVIAVVAPSLEILGGQGVQADALARSLAHEGFDLRFVPINPRFPTGLRWLRRVPLLRTALNQLIYVPTLARLRGADVVHVFSASYWSFLLAPVPAMLAARLFGKPVVLNYHSGEASDHLDNWGWRVHPWLRLADTIAVPSDFLRRVFAEHGYQAEVIRNIVDTSSFRFRPRSPLRPALLSNRNLEPHYRVLDNLKAFAEVKRRHPEATLTVAGYGSEDAMLKRWVRDQGLQGVTFLGRVEPAAMPGLFDQADIYLNASVVDNQPLSILEAFAAGLNVVSTPTGDIDAMLGQGERGMLVPPGDPRAMADAVDSLLEDPARALEMAQAARREVEKYTWPYVSKEWADLYTRHWRESGESTQ